MAEKIVPDVEVFAQEIAKELKLDLPTQRMKLTERLINFSPEKMSEIHLQDWYSLYWKLADLLQYINAPKEQTENACIQIKSFIAREADPVRRQYFALALLLFGKFQEFQSLADKKLWSENLREDFDTFMKFNKLTSLSSNLAVRAHTRRKQQIYNFLQNKYSVLINEHSNPVVNDKTCPKVSPKDYQIYFCWLQGEDNLPPLIQCCYNSLKVNAGKYKVVFIDEKSYANYITLPEHILKKFSEGKISRTHFSDIVRVNLLEQYGGLWLDSTILVTEPLEKYKHFWKMPYFTQKFYQEKSLYNHYFTNPSFGRWATFILGSAILHNPFFVYMKDFYNEYWRDFDEIIDYVLMDYMMDIAYENIPFVKQEFDAVPINNDRAWSLLGTLNLPYDRYPYDKIFKGNFLNKLNWKSQFDWQTPNTVLREIQKRYAPETLKL